MWNRTQLRAEGLARELGVEHARGPRAADVLVNATSVGLRGETEEQLLGELPLAGSEAGIVVDLVYGERPTALSLWAARRGARVVDGVEVLVRQGGRSFERWTGRPAPLETMRRAAVVTPV